MSKEIKGTTIFIHDKHAKMLDEMRYDESRSRAARRMIEEGHKKWKLQKEAEENATQS